MNHASKERNNRQLDSDHDYTSKIPFKSSQPPIKMASRQTVDTGWGSADTRIYYAKKYRQMLSSAPACALAVVAGVSSQDAMEV